LLLETLLLAVFLVLDILLFYIFFESILPPLFILIGLFGSNNRVRASFYLFLYTFFLKCKRAKHRGSPKTLVTKVIREILILAPLMPGGMVKSLVFISEKHLQFTDVDTWVIAVLSHLKYIKRRPKNKQSIGRLIYKGVKEQRVDGSSKSSYVGDFVKCTLVAGKPVFGTKIHSHPDKINSLPLKNSNLVFSRCIHSNSVKNKELAFTSENKVCKILPSIDPWFITGLIDAEGCFTIGFFKSDKYKMAYQIVAIFKIALHKKDFYLLSQIRDYFGEGSITKHGETTIQYTIKSLHYLKIVISHFDKYPLQTGKAADFKLFKQAILLIKNKEHLNRKGFINILSIKSSMYLGLSDELKLSFPDIKPASRSYNLEIVPISFYWFAGLVSGDGCFHISIRNSPTTITGKSVVLKFHVVQHSRDTELIKKLISTFACGRIELALKQSAVYFVVTNLKDILEKIIPVFDKYPIKGVKALDYENFKKAVQIMQNKEHLTEQGFSKMQTLKLSMNSFREK